MNIGALRPKALTTEGTGYHRGRAIPRLPQIAASADHHYLIEKRETGGRAKATVRQITGEERTEEVARMLSGAKLTETSRKHAEQMIRASGENGCEHTTR